VGNPRFRSTGVALVTIGPMTIPSRDEACLLLLDFKPSRRLVRHMTAVAEIAAFLAERTERRGIPVDRRLVENAALLHDIDKAYPRGDEAHGEAGARWLAEHGHPELSEAVALHSVSRLGDDGQYAAFAAGASREARIVAYADKRAAQRLAPMDRRFVRWERRHPEMTASMVRARERALLLEQQVCQEAGVAPEAVRRLRWVSAAMARARRQRDAATPDPPPRPRPAAARRIPSSAAP
jgi:putative nucleotidyltransferase with HDIG domain